MRYINFNGQLQSENIPVLHAWNRSFQYGDGLFESIAVSSGLIPFFDDHWNRMTESAGVLLLELSPDFTKEFLRKSILELLSVNSMNENAYARVMLFREGKGKYAPDLMQTGFMIEAEPLAGELFTLNEKGLTLGVFTSAQKSVDRLANFKTCSALVYVLASIHKTKSGMDDCLILNSRSNISDSTNSNVFLVKDKIISTPSIEEGCISGVMRKQIISLAKKIGFVVTETAIGVEMLRQADEIFLTNAVSGIRWVGKYHTCQYKNDVASLFSDSLRKSLH